MPGQHLQARIMMTTGYYDPYRELIVNGLGSIFFTTIRQEKGLDRSADAQRPLHPAPIFGKRPVEAASPHGFK
tara:strand:- start:491 stop:709 length:219 start_codon:yes stop_codon:yes gene_type:complete